MKRGVPENFSEILPMERNAVMQPNAGIQYRPGS